jgi:hypothetical protein
MLFIVSEFDNLMSFYLFHIRAFLQANRVTDLFLLCMTYRVKEMWIFVLIRLNQQNAQYLRQNIEHFVGLILRTGYPHCTE